MSGTMMGQGMSCPIPSQPVAAADPMLVIMAADAVVLYMDDGTIVHTYQKVTAVGGVHPTAAQREAEAMSNYAQMQPNATRNVNVLHVAGYAYPRNLAFANQTFKVVNCAVVPG